MQQKKYSTISWIVVIALLVGMLIALLGTFAPASACAPHELPERRQGSTETTCVAHCAKGQIYVSIALNGSSHCVTEQNTIHAWFIFLLRFLAAGVGVAVVGGIIWGGLLYLTAQGNSAQTQKAVSIIVNAIVGLVLFTLLFALVNFLIPGGVLQ